MFANTIKKIKFIEENFNVNSLIYNDVKVWPVIRYFILFDLMNLKSRPEIDIFDEKKWAETLVNTSKSFLNDINLLHKLRNRECETKDNFYKKTDVVMLLMSDSRNEKINNRYFHKFSDSTKHFMPRDTKVTLLEWSSRKEHRVPRYSEANSIDHIIALSALEKHINIMKYGLFSEENTISNIESFFDFLESNNITLGYSTQFLNRFMSHIFILKGYFVNILKQIQPKLLITQYYPALAHYAMILACREMGIKSADLQHGTMGEFNGIYFHFEKSVPNEGYDLMPDYFFVWDKVSKSRIDRWANKTKKHSVIVTGNPWLSLYKSDCSLQEKLEFIDHDKSIRILITIQPQDDFLPEWIDDFILETASVYQWLVRLHPSHPAMVNYESKILSRLAKLAQHGVNTHHNESTSAKLYDLLESVDLHLTSHSSVAFEALEFNVPTFLFGNKCYEYMGGEITKEIFKVIKNRTDFNMNLNKINQKNSNFSRNYNNCNAMSNTLQYLLSNKDSNES